MLKDAVQSEREQEADCSRIHAAVHLAETTIAALAGSDEAHERRRELRDQTILAVADVRRNIIVRAEQAKETRREMIQALFRDRMPSLTESTTINQLLLRIKELARLNQTEG